MVLGCVGMAGDGSSSWLGIVALVAIGLVITAMVKGSGNQRRREEPSLPVYPFAAADAPRLDLPSAEDSEKTNQLVGV